jgi:flagella basal body P-ring formation protein FlgA
MTRPATLRPATLIRLFGAGLLLAATQLPAAAQQTAASAATLSMLPVATLKSTATVNGAEIRLGDLFEGTGAHGQDVVADAPMPGSTLLFDQAWLSATAADHGLNWLPASQFASIRVSRAATVIDGAQIAQQLSEKLTGGRPDRRVRLNNTMRLYVPVGSSTDIAVDNLEFDQASGRFNADLRVPADDPTAQPVHVSGTVEATIQLPALSHAMMPGDVIGQDDVTWITLPISQVPAGDITDARRMFGSSPRHPLQAGIALQPYDLQQPILVHRNTLVLIVLQQPGLYITAEGKAMDDGGRGSVIPVTNIQSNRIIQAVVTGDGQVGIPMPGMNAATVAAAN